MSEETAKLVAQCGGVAQMVDAGLQFVRLLWRLTMNDSGERGFYRRLDENQLRAEMPWEVVSGLLNHPQTAQFLSDNLASFKLPILRPSALASALLEGALPKADIRYFVRRNMRRHYNAAHTPETAYLFHLMAGATNLLIDRKRAQSPASRTLTVEYETEFRGCLTQALTSALPGPGNWEKPVDLFVECCREVGYLEAHKANQSIILRAAAADAEYLLACLFGLPTSIEGFDELFGGGGLMLAEQQPALAGQQLGGRTVLVKGRFATGKTLLSLQLAVEVARKGGLCWLMPLEQAATEYLYLLRSMGAVIDDSAVVIATDIEAALKVLDEPRRAGAIIILKTVKTSFEAFLKAFVDNARQMQKYPLRLIGVDPINSVIPNRPHDATELRARTWQMLEEVKEQGTNVMLVAEEETGIGGQLFFEQNIADTVIQLSIEKKHNYATRYFEITKSRLQREQRGAHPFHIKPGDGIVISPSTAAVRSRIRPRRPRPESAPTSIVFGLPSLDDVLGKDSLSAGDVLVLQGPKGAFKLLLGLHFLLSADRTKGTQRPRSLLVSARETKEAIELLLNQPLLRRHIQEQKSPKQPPDIEICALPGGHINPSYILQRIEEELKKVQAGGHRIDRVMVDNVAHWEKSCPQVREDETFGDTLVDFLRRQGVTSLFTCGELPKDLPSVLQWPIIDSADCVIQLGHFEHRGVSRVMLKVAKTRGMRHRQESFELALGANALSVEKSSALLRVRGNRVEPVKTSLFLHSETQMQEDYNRRFFEAVRAVISPQVALKSQDHVYQGRPNRLVSRVLRLGTYSTLDELQILQLDEFQVPESNRKEQPEITLHTFAAEDWDQDWTGAFVTGLEEKIRQRGGGFSALPFYENVSLLAYRRDSRHNLGRAAGSWLDLAQACADWERSHSAPKLFFDFPRGTGENYNCLFFEIMLSTLPRASFQSLSGPCGLLEWLRRPEALRAAQIYRQLCHRTHKLGKESSEEKSRAIIHANPEALVWRHWYSTLNQMLSQMPAKVRAEVEVTTLPGNVTTAGEWYLGIPVYSAAPDIGLEIIKLLTSREAEFDRLRLGVGLPTRRAFYREIDTNVSPFFTFRSGQLDELVNHAFRRSNFGCYAQLSDILAFHLQQIIEIPSGSTDEIEEQIARVLLNLERSIGFVRREQDCGKCRIGHTMQTSFNES